MITPAEIRLKAENLYREFLAARLDGKEDFFPRVIPCRKTPDGEDLAAAIAGVRALREGSKEARGHGYTVEWRETNSRKFGRNSFPARILFETSGDYLRFIGKEREFESFEAAVRELRGAFPSLEKWVRGNVRTLIDAAPVLPSLLAVLRYFCEHPRPDRFARELPLPVDTKFIERHQRLLAQWFDLVLPPGSIRADEEHFERRYGLRYAQPHLLVRLLDPALIARLGFPCDEFSLPLHALGKLAATEVKVFIVENKVNLLTLPPLPGTIGLGGLGNGVSLLRYVPWLATTPILYWGDIDVEGFEILSSLRSLYPQTRSLLMDAAALERGRGFAVAGSGRKPSAPPNLTAQEMAAFAICGVENLRIEQEHVTPERLLATLRDVTAEPASEVQFLSQVGLSADL